MQYLGLLHGSVLVNKQWGLAEFREVSDVVYFPTKFNVTPRIIATHINLAGVANLKSFEISNINLDRFKINCGQYMYSIHYIAINK
ncbi:Uncharacterised protein [Megamonas hypermegale]|uniref:Uncharacterized protein n=1 Tax=Megamonas hypermegale TaxID=158847 RepID=A0A378NUG4_9FIRM|nr:hypothetical protein [Megamonas hypermegale]STY71465.1 Uncharacterised protein [Megamonas hypermegale]